MYLIAVLDVEPIGPLSHVLGEQTLKHNADCGADTFISPADMSRLGHILDLPEQPVLDTNRNSNKQVEQAGRGGGG